MGVLPWVAAGGYELGRRAITSPWFLNLLQLYLWGEQEVEIRTIQRAIDRHMAGAEPEQIPGAPEGCVWPPRVGSGDWYDMIEELETEFAASGPDEEW